MRKKLVTLRGWLLERGLDANPQRGAIDIGGILIMGIGMVFLAVGFIMFPIVTDATHDLVTYVYSGNASCGNATAGSAGTFTGFVAVAGITPLLVLIGYLSAGLFSMYLGVKVMKAGEGESKINLGTLLLLGISMIFIAIGLIIMPVTLDAICDTLGKISPTEFTGLVPILKITPLLVLISFIAGAVISGFFGLKRLGG